jgi:hypothetical protein
MNAQIGISQETSQPVARIKSVTFPDSTVSFKRNKTNQGYYLPTDLRIDNPIRPYDLDQQQRWHKQNRVPKAPPAPRSSHPRDSSRSSSHNGIAGVTPAFGSVGNKTNGVGNFEGADAFECLQTSTGQDSGLASSTYHNSPVPRCQDNEHIQPPTALHDPLWVEYQKNLKRDFIAEFGSGCSNSPGERNIASRNNPDVPLDKNQVVADKLVELRILLMQCLPPREVQQVVVACYNAFLISGDTTLLDKHLALAR